MTTTAAPISFMSRAFLIKLSSPSLRLMEFTIGRPCTHFSPPMTTFQSEESIITGTRATSGSTPMRERNDVMHARASSMASSMFISIIWAPASTWLRAMSIASSMLPSFISRRNLRLPATLQRSPTLTKLSLGVTHNGSRPASVISGSTSGTTRGAYCLHNSASALMCCGVVPQHPPTIFTHRRWSMTRILSAIIDGVSSYSPISLGSPAFG